MRLEEGIIFAFTVLVKIKKRRYTHSRMMGYSGASNVQPLTRCEPFDEGKETLRSVAEGGKKYI